MATFRFHNCTAECQEPSASPTQGFLSAVGHLRVSLWCFSDISGPLQCCVKHRSIMTVLARRCGHQEVLRTRHETWLRSSRGAEDEA